MRHILLFLIPFVVQCSLLETKNEKNAFELRDVPMQARGADEGLRSRVLVLPFLSDEQVVSQNTLEELRNTFTRELFRTKQFIVVSASDLNQDPKKMMTDKNEYDMQQIARIASGQGITAVIEGKILGIQSRKLGDSVGLFRESKSKVNTDVRIRIFGGRSGREIFNEQKEASVEASSTKVAFGEESEEKNSLNGELIRQGLRKGFLSVLPNFARAMEKLSWEGRVAMISGERVFINAGRLSGLQMGDILKVTEEGDEVYDPETGRFIGVAPGRMKGTVEVIGYFGKDGAIAIIHSGSGFRENDRLELY